MNGAALGKSGNNRMIPEQEKRFFFDDEVLPQLLLSTLYAG
jgi:hypothetical protein